MSSGPAATRPSTARLRLWSELSVHFLLVMEATWVATWYQALHRFHEAWVVDFLALGGFFVAGYWLSRLLSEWNFKWRWQRIFFGLWLAGALGLSFKLLLYPDLDLNLLQLYARPIQAIFRAVPEQGEFWHLLIFFALALRAIDVARTPIDHRRLLLNFQIGIFAFMVYGVVYSLSIRAVSLSPLFLFLFCGLMMLACGRVSQISELRGGRLPGIQTHWAAGIALAALALILVALFAGWVFDVALARAVATLIFLIFGLLTTVFLLLLSPFLMVIEYVIRWLQQRMTTPEAQETFNLFNQLFNKISNVDQSLKNVVNILEHIEPYFLVVILALILIGAILWLGWRPLKEVLLGEQDVQNLPRPPVKFGLPRVAVRLPAARRASQLLGAARIRQIYARLLALSARLGHPRPPARTPNEFLPTLASLFPDRRAELECITRAYLRVRYGLLPESDAEVQTVLDAWQSVNLAGRQLAALLKKQSDANR